MVPPDIPKPFYGGEPLQPLPAPDTPPVSETPPLLDPNARLMDITRPSEAASNEETGSSQSDIPDITRPPQPADYKPQAGEHPDDPAPEATVASAAGSAVLAATTGEPPHRKPVTGRIPDSPGPTDVPAAAEDIAPPANDLEIPANITELLDNNLVPTGHSGDTALFEVEGHPDLYVRLNEGFPPNERTEAKQAADRLVPHGVHVLPTRLVEHNDEVYVVTEKVTGVQLDTVLTPDAPDELVEQVDKTWAGLADGFAECKQNGTAVPGDVTDTFQYMYGTTASKDRPGVCLVDHPKSSNTLEGDIAYGEEILDIVNSVLDIEERTGRELPAARAALGRAIAQSDVSPRFGDGYARAAEHALRARVHVYSDSDDEIRRFATRFA